MKVLLVDDNQQIAKMLSTALELEGHNCHAVNEGKEGLRLIEDNDYDWVLLDLTMPDFSGFDVINELEKKGKLQKNKIIVFTAATIPQEQLEGLVKRGVNSFLTKPVDLEVLMKKIASVK